MIISRKPAEDADSTHATPCRPSQQGGDGFVVFLVFMGCRRFLGFGAYGRGVRIQGLGRFQGFYVQGVRFTGQ